RRRAGSREGIHARRCGRRPAPRENAAQGTGGKCRVYANRKPGVWMEIPFAMNRAELQTRGERVRAPVLIVGAKRSGTTLLQLTLNRHPQLAMCGETAFLTRVYARRRGLGTDTGVLRERLRSEGVSWGAFFAALIQVYADAQGKPYCGEKTPGHALYATTLCQWFPNCAIIHLVR